MHSTRWVPMCAVLTGIVASGCTGSHYAPAVGPGTSHTSAARGGTSVMACPYLGSQRVPASEMQHSGAAADRVVRDTFHPDSIIERVPVLTVDPVAPKVGLGSATTPRKFWAVVRREVARKPLSDRLPTGATPPPAGTVFVYVTLVDDATLKLGGNFGPCG